MDNPPDDLLVLIMKISVFAAIALFVSLFACNTLEKENEKLHEEVIAIHDEVMPVMGKVKSLQNNLLENVDKLKKEDSLAHGEKIQTMITTASELDMAYENMFVWMRQFNTEYGNMTAEEANLYLKEQKKSVAKVNSDIKEALAKGEALNQ
jgi:uncharacterized coiled-coil DUF342 family protein